MGKMNLTSGTLLLEGGSFRGIYTAGVLDVLLQNDIHMSDVVGVSAGAMNALGYVADMEGFTRRILIGNCDNPRYAGLSAMLENRGAIGFRYMFGDLLEIIDFDEEAFLTSPQKFFAAATNCETGETEYFEKSDCPDIYKAVQASSSMQILCRQTKLGESTYLDGGITVSCALSFALERGYEKLVAVLTRPLDYRKSALPKRTEAAYRLLYRRFPNLLSALCQADITYNAEREELTKLVEAGKAYVIAPPSLLDIGRVERNSERLEEGYRCGRLDALNSLSGLRDYLDS